MYFLEFKILMEVNHLMLNFNLSKNINFNLINSIIDGKDEIIASIFFNGKVSVFYNNNGTFSDPNSWNERLVTNTIVFFHFFFILHFFFFNLWKYFRDHLLMLESQM